MKLEKGKQKTRNVFFPRSESQGSKAGRWWTVPALETQGENLSLPVPGSGGSRNSAASKARRHLPPASASVFTWPSAVRFWLWKSQLPSLYLTRIAVFEFLANLILRSLTWVHLQRSCFQVKSHSQMPGSETLDMFLRRYTILLTPLSTAWIVLYFFKIKVLAKCGHLSCWV